jgi:FixJ family two-component response regulator
MSEPAFTIFLVDDDARVLKALSRLLRIAGYQTQSFSSPQAFLTQHDPSVAGCAIFDLSMPGFDGLTLQAQLTAAGINRPIIFLTGKGDIAASVRAIKAGAIDFLTKPVNDHELLADIERARDMALNAYQMREELAALETKIATLTPRERQVLGYVISGRLNKQIAGDLGVVEKTIKVHRSRVMRKLAVRSVADLVRLADRAGIKPACRSA